jgi:hypothetical protein
VRLLRVARRARRGAAYIQRGASSFPSRSAPLQGAALARCSVHRERAKCVAHRQLQAAHCRVVWLSCQCAARSRPAVTLRQATLVVKAPLGHPTARTRNARTLKDAEEERTDEGGADALLCNTQQQRQQQRRCHKRRPAVRSTPPTLQPSTKPPELRHQQLSSRVQRQRRRHACDAHTAPAAQLASADRRDSKSVRGSARSAGATPALQRGLKRSSPPPSRLVTLTPGRASCRSSSARVNTMSAAEAL